MAMMSSDNHGLRLVVRYLVLVLIALIFCFPLVFMVVSSFKPDQQLLMDSGNMRAFLPVGDLSFNNYTEAFSRAPVGLFIFNSVFVTGVTVILSLLLCSAAGFAFTFVEWRGRNIALSIILATLIVPFETTAIPLLLLGLATDQSQPQTMSNRSPPRRTPHGISPMKPSIWPFCIQT